MVEAFPGREGKAAHQVQGQGHMAEEGEFLVVPRGTEHLPVAEQEAHVLLLEPKSTLNTGNVRNEKTVAELERL